MCFILPSIQKKKKKKSKNGDCIIFFYISHYIIDLRVNFIVAYWNVTLSKWTSIYYSTSRRSSFDHILASPESTAKTADSGIESLAKRLSEDTQFGSSLGSSPEPASTGNEQVDQALMHHLVYAEKLLEVSQFVVVQVLYLYENYR